MKRFKTRAQAVIALVVIIVAAAMTFYHISQDKRFTHERTEHASEAIRLTFDAIVHDVEHFYQFRSPALLNSAEVLKAIRESDSDHLYRLILPRYNALREENPYLTIMQFHAADGCSIVRIHMKARHGDNIAARRPMLREIHANHAMISGFEGGLGGIAFRVIVPIFDQGNYIGALEYGLDTDYFIQRIKQFAGSETVMMIHREWLGAADRNLFSRGIGEYYFPAGSEERQKLIESYADRNPDLQPRHIVFNNRAYEVNTLVLQDSRHRNLGLLISIDDVTGITPNFLDILLGSFLITAIMIAVLWGMFEYAFRALIGKVTLQERYIETILDSQKNMVIVTDGQQIIYANHALLDYFHAATLEEFWQKYQCVCTLFESSATQEYLQPEMDGMRWTDYLILNAEKENQAKITIDGKTSIFTVHSKKMEYGGEIRHVVVFTDITRLNELATQDILTGLANRFQFDKVLEHSIYLAIRHKAPLSLLLIDIDHFKQVNDRYGHLAGDEVLKKLATILQNGVRKSDVVARWGGEELVVLLPDSELVSAAKLAETLRMRIEEGDFTPVERVTCSIGAVQWQEGENTDVFLRRADEKLYQAKEEGRNRVVS